jgi:bifunctional non-homologous end joining protein LigD
MRVSKRRTARVGAAKLPQVIEVQLATLVPAAPQGPEWLHEIKFDGYRLMARVGRGAVQLFTRNHLDWTGRYPEIACALESLPVRSAILDGEVVAQSEGGVSSFQALQNAVRNNATNELVYYAFDLLYLNGIDLRAKPLSQRKKLLKELVATTGQKQIQFSDHWDHDGQRFWKECCRRGLEGIISKRRDRPYRSGRSTDWLKVKRVLREEFVIGGYTASPARHRKFGALLVGYFEKKALIYAGRVGTGFDALTLLELHDRLAKLQIDRPPFAELPARELRDEVRWVQPRLVAQIDFGGWTTAHILRHPSFQGLREDKPAAGVGHPESLRPSKASASQTRRKTKRSMNK